MTTPKYEKDTTAQMVVAEMDRIAKDEGLVLEIYLCPAKKPTFGFGTLITPEMPEYGQPIGTPVTEERCLEAFFEEMRTVHTDTPRAFPKHWDDFPSRVKKVFVNVIYNLGLAKFRRFTKTRQAARAGDWDTTATELLDSKYARDVGPRAERLAKRLRGSR